MASSLCERPGCGVVATHQVLGEENCDQGWAQRRLIDCCLDHVLDTVHYVMQWSLSEVIIRRVEE